MAESRGSLLAASQRRLAHHIRTPTQPTRTAAINSAHSSGMRSMAETYGTECHLVYGPAVDLQISFVLLLTRTGLLRLHMVRDGRN